MHFKHVHFQRLQHLLYIPDRAIQSLPGHGIVVSSAPGGAAWKAPLVEEVGWRGPILSKRLILQVVKDEVILLSQFDRWQIREGIQVHGTADQDEHTQWFFLL